MLKARKVNFVKKKKKMRNKYKFYRKNNFLFHNIKFKLNGTYEKKTHSKTSSK